MVKMSSKQKRPIGDANEDMDPNKRAKRDGERPAKNMDSSTTSSLGASQRDPSPTTSAALAAKDTWRLGHTRRAIFAKIQSLEGRGAVDSQQNVVRENLARRRVYEDMYAKGCGSSNAAAITANVEYAVDARLWADHVQNRTSEEFPWEQPEIFREDTGYADFVKSIAHAGKWSAIVLDGDETVQGQRKKASTETEAKLMGENKDSTNISTRIDETQRPSEDRDGDRVAGEPQLVMRNKALVAESVTAAPVDPVAKTHDGGEAEKTPWSWEQMTELYKEIFGPEAPRLEGMGGFELPMERPCATQVRVTKGSIKEAKMLFPASVELRPVTLGWGRFKLCLQFAPWVTRGKTDFPVHKYNLVWSWCILVQWKSKLLNQASDAEKASESPASMYDGIRWVIDHCTEEAAKSQADLSLVDEAWGLEVRADKAGLDDEASKQRLYDAVSKLLASSRGQDDETRACAVVDWAGADPEKFGAGARTRTYLALEAMCRYCASKAGEGKLGVIAQQMKSEKHVAPALMKKWAGQAAKDSNSVPK